MRVSISDTRATARAHPELRDQLLALIATAESLRDLHDAECGCGRAGIPAHCVWPPPDALLVACFEFDEEEVAR